MVPIGSTDPSDPDSTGIFQARPLREFLSPAAKRFRLDQVINPLQFSAFNVFVDNKAKRAVRLEQSEWTPEGLGRFFGATAAHEFGHNVGFLDEYQNDTNATTLFGDTFMSRAGDGNTTVIDEHELSMALAFNNPDRNPPPNAFLLDDLIYNFWQETDRNDAVLHAGRGVRSLQGTAGITSLVGSEQRAGGDALTPELLVLAAQLPALAMWEVMLGADLSLNIDIKAESLPTGELAEARITQLGTDGLAVAATIVLDSDGLGLGWFIDPTPLAADEFIQETTTSFLASEASSPAAGKYDLLTVLFHEIGHLAGFSAEYQRFTNQTITDPNAGRLFAGAEFVASLSGDGNHLQSSGHPGDLMTSTLIPSTRRLPSKLDARIIAAVRGTIGSNEPTGRGSGVPVLSSPWTEDGLASSGIQGVPLDPERRTTQVQINDADMPVAGMLSGGPIMSLPGGITNGSFSVSDPEDPQFGWTFRGVGAVTGGAAILQEDERVFSRLSQSFVVPDGARSLSFTIAIATFGTAIDGPPDAFEVAFLDATTMLPLVSTPTELTKTDTLLNIQQDGRVYFGSQVTMPGVPISGEVASFDSPITITVDLHGVAPGTSAILYFDLLGFAPNNTTVSIDDVFVSLEGTDQQAPRGSLLTPSPTAATNRDLGYVDIQWTDSGPAGLDPTSLDVTDVIITGVSVDRSEVLGNGRVRYWYDDDGDRVVDGVIQVVTHAGGVLDLAGNAAPAQLFSFAFDTQSPQARFVVPSTAAIFETDLGYLEVQWDDQPAGVDQQSLDAGDIKIQGVTVDRVEPLASGGVRYWYNDDGDKLRLGTIVVTVPSDQVVDQAGNLIPASIASLRRLRLACPWSNLFEQNDSNDDAFVTPQDALVTINQLNRRSLIDEAGRFATPGVADLVPPPFYDVNCDNFVTPQDVLVVINELNRRNMASEGESAKDTERLALSPGALSRSQLVPPESEQRCCAFHDIYFSAQASERPTVLNSATRSSELPISAASERTRINGERASSARTTYRARNLLSHENVEDLLQDLTVATTAHWHDHNTHDCVFDGWR